MAILFTPDIGLSKPDLYADQKETYYGDAFDQINRVIGGYLTVASGDANYTLLDTLAARESRTLVLKLTSTLTAARTIKIPIDSGTYRNRLFLIWNATAGGFKVTIKTTASGSPTGVDVANGYCRLVFHDGTNVYAAGPEINPTTGDVLSPSPTYTAPSLLNSWINFGSTFMAAGYTLHLGTVRLRGTIKSGTINAVLFTLPAGYRPSADLIFPCNSAGALGVIVVEADGDVVQVAGGNTSLSLDGISFTPT